MWGYIKDISTLIIAIVELEKCFLHFWNYLIKPNQYWKRRAVSTKMISRCLKVCNLFLFKKGVSFCEN